MHDDRAKQLQAEGNALYSSGRYEDARASYSAAIALLETALGEVSNGSSSSSSNNVTNTCAPANAATAALTASQLFSNRAQTYIQERNFAAALHDCIKALKHNPANEKASVRRLVALENLERFESALALVETVLEQRGARDHSPALFQYAVTARRRLRKTLARDKEAAASEASQMGKMVHEHQQLRINFGSLMPAQVPLGEFVDVVVNIGNEFGLFRRSAVRPGERVFLQCSLRDGADTLALTFHAAGDASDASDDSDFEVRADGRLTLNNRGKVAFRVAVVAADSASTTSETAMRARVALMVSVHADSRSTWDLFPVVSLPFDVVSPPHVRVESTVSDLGVHCCRPVAMAGIDREILLAESPGNLGIGGKLWDSCLVMTRYLALNRHLIEHKRVVELGSGLGLVGIFCAMLGASVTLTDMAEVVPLLQYNIALNFPTSSSTTSTITTSTSSSSREGTGSDSGDGVAFVPTAATHCWGTSTAQLPVPHPDVLVLSDVVYDPEGYAPLVASLNALASAHTVVLMAHRSRNPMEHQFFDLLARTFAFELVDWASCFAAASDHEQQQSQQSHATAPTTTTSTLRVLQDVKIFRMQRL